MRGPLFALSLILGASLTAGACAQPFDEAPVALEPAAPALPDASIQSADAGSGLAFSACPGGYSGLCAKIEMPLDWSNTSGKTVGVLVDKIVTMTKPKAQVWVLQGGPGGTAADMVPLARDLAQNLEDVEIFTIEHRGVGASNRLSCPTQEAAGMADAAAFDLVACTAEAKARFGDDLRHYNITNAARDLAHAIERTRRENVKAYVYGVSYGTLWAERLMQVAPKAADAIILDSLVVPGQQLLSKFDPQGDVVAQKLAELCKSDASCNAALGPDPWAKILAAKEKVDQGHCPEIGLGPRERTKLLFPFRIHALMGYGLALWHRIDRCNADDIAAVKQFLSREFRSPNEALSSSLLGINIMVSEMFETPFPSKATMLARFDDAVFPAGVGLDYDSLASWPRYTPDAFAGVLPEPQVPVLVLAGGLDSQTPIEVQELAKEHFERTGTFVSIPNGNHGLINQSPVTGGGPPFQCGMTLITAFLTDPNAPLDTACASKVAAPSFGRPSAEVEALLGTDDLWLGPPRHGALADPGFVADVARIPRLFF
jgi:pimeloyl-ACP methyl ester carboxylesterase